MIHSPFFHEKRQEAVRWARDRLSREFVLFDTETTGIEAYDEVIQVGAVDREGNVLIDSLIKTNRSIHPRAQALHGISAAHLVQAPPFKDVYPALADLLRGRLVIAYNAKFDRRMLQQTCISNGLPMIEAAGWECAMEWYAAFYGAWNRKYGSFRWQSLSDACAHEQIPIVQVHSAVDDCLLTLRLLRKMAETEL